MMYSKKELADSIIKFISNDLMTADLVSQTKFALCIAKKALHENPDILDGFLNSPIVTSVIKENDGMYDIDLFARTVKNVLSEYDSYAIHIPGIPMFAPKESVIKITAMDVDKITTYLQPVAQ